MYRAFFGLMDLPFRSTPDLEFFYKDADREQIVSALIYSLERGDAIVKVVGEVGSGKTTLLRMLSQKLSSQYSTVYINTPNLSAHDILFFICVEFGLSVERTEQKYFLTKKLQDFLLSQHSENRKPIVLIDEAQAMPLETLEEIRLLTNLETEQDKLLQIVLFGQPELDSNLNEPQVRQFMSRIAHSISLEPFSKQDVHSYLNFRMRKAGYQGRDVFDSRAARLIHKLSKGLPRNIHILADKALLAAYSEGARHIGGRHILDSNSLKIQSYVRWAASIFLFVSLSAFLFLKSENLADVSFSNFTKFVTFFDNSGSLEVQTAQDPGFTEDAEQRVLLNIESQHEHTLNPGLDIALTKSQLEKTLGEVESNASMRYSIQLMTNHIDQFARIKAVLEENKTLNPQYLIYVPLPEEGVFIVYYGQYEGFSHAVTNIKKFSQNILVGKPFVISKSQLVAQLKRSLEVNT
mgnify:CR=1 FL=1